MGRFLSKLLGLDTGRRLPPRNKRVVVVTGCDSGFGHNLALKLDQAGYVVVATCLTDDGAHALKEKLKNPRALVIPKSDVTKDESVKELATTVRTTFPNGIWGLVNNAGVYTIGNVELAPMSQYRRMMEVNFFGVVAVTKALLPSLRENKGRIVQLSSIVGTSSIPDLSAYSASKFALDAFSDALRREMLPFDVDVILVKPGYAKTNLMNNTLIERDRLWESSSEELKLVYDSDMMNAIRRQHERQFERAIDPIDVVNVLFRAVDEAEPNVHCLVGLRSHIAYWMEYLLPVRLAGVHEKQDGVMIKFRKTNTAACSMAG